MSEPTAREYGALEREVLEIRHDLRNARTVIQLQGDAIHDLDAEIGRMKVRLATALAAVLLGAGFVGWALGELRFWLGERL